MPPHLHPRSRSTTSLFTTCLTISFLVVGIPHVLPCPANTHRQLSDDGTDNTTRVKRRRKIRDDESLPVAASQNQVHNGRGDVFGNANVEKEGERDRERECPVPKPGGFMGRLLGFQPADITRREVIVSEKKSKMYDEHTRRIRSEQEHQHERLGNGGGEG